jgi:hypothetical protein
MTKPFAMAFVATTSPLRYQDGAKGPFEENNEDKRAVDPRKGEK